MNKLIIQSGGKFLVLFVPEIAQIAPSSDLLEANPQKYFMYACQELGLNCVDPHPQFLEKQKQLDLYFMDDGHFSPAGAKLAAEILNEGLSDPDSNQ